MKKSGPGSNSDPSPTGLTPLPTHSLQNNVTCYFIPSGPLHTLFLLLFTPLLFLHLANAFSSFKASPSMPSSRKPSLTPVVGYGLPCAPMAPHFSQNDTSMFTHLMSICIICLFTVDCWRVGNIFILGPQFQHKAWLRVEPESTGKIDGWVDTWVDGWVDGQTNSFSPLRETDFGLDSSTSRKSLLI